MNDIDVAALLARVKTLSDAQTSDEALDLVPALVSALKEALVQQRRYEFLRDSGWVTLYERVYLDRGVTVIFPGRIAHSIVDDCVDECLAQGRRS